MNTITPAQGHETAVMIPIRNWVLMTLHPYYQWAIFVHHVSQTKQKTLIREGVFKLIGFNVAISQILRPLKNMEIKIIEKKRKQNVFPDPLTEMQPFHKF